MMRGFSHCLFSSTIVAGLLTGTISPSFALSELQSEEGDTLTEPIQATESGVLPSSQPDRSGPASAPDALPPLQDEAPLAPAGEPGPVEVAPLPPPSAPETVTDPDPQEVAPSDEMALPDGSDDQTGSATPTEGSAEEVPASDAAGPAPETKPQPPISYDLSQLPEPVARMRNLILDAAKTGNIENLRPLFGMGSRQTALSLGGIEEDPIAFLKEISGDDEGQEVLAILSEILEAGYVHFDEGKPTELYVWPYFFARSLETLTPEQKVELFRIVTAGDYADMVDFGAYVFYRAGIRPEGVWDFFVAGD